MEKRFVSWPHTPISGVSVSASGLLALADLSTTAKRTALTGTSTWLDVLVLAPGLHYQQSAESIGQAHSGHAPDVTNLNTGSVSRVTNAATVHYLQRIGRPDQRVILDVGATSPARGAHKSRPARLGPRGQILQSSSTPPSSKLSTGLYLLGPLLTVAATVLLILTQDWWGLGIVLALMVSRALNVYIIQQRTKEQPPPSDQPNVHQCWWVVVGGDRRICLRGLRHDLEAITTGSWMRAMTNVEGYLEAAAKLIVYMVAVFSGNQFQSGDIILMVLLLCSAGLLALSNAYASTFNMNGRTASVTPDSGAETQPEGSVLPTVSDPSKVGATGSRFEKEEAAAVVETAHPFADEVNYV